AGHHRQRDRALLGRGRDVGLQEGVLRALAEGREAALRRRARRRAGHGDRLPARRPADHAGDRPHGPASHPASRRRLRTHAMTPISPDEVLNLYEYEKVREARREAVIALKQIRREAVGRYLSFVFENRDTVLFQIQEMVRAERIVDDATVADEIEAYNALP